MANVAINVEVRSNGEVVLGKIGDQLEGVGKKARESQTQMDKFMESMKEGVGIGAGFSVGAAAAEKLMDSAREVTRYLADVVKQTTEFAEQMTKLQLSTGMTSQSLQVLHAVAKETNTDFGALTKAVGKLEIAIGSNAKELGQLGLSQEELKKSSPEEAMGAVVQKLLAMNDVYERNAIASKLFGKGFLDILPALAEMGTSTERFVTLSEDQLEKMNELDAASDKLGTAWSELERQLAAVIVGGSGAADTVGMLASSVRDFGAWIKDNRESIEFLVGAVKLISGYSANALGNKIRGAEDAAAEALLGVAPETPKMKQNPFGSSIFTGSGFPDIAGPTSAEQERDKQRAEHQKQAEADAEKYAKLVEKFQDRARIGAQKQQEEMLKDVEKSEVYKLGEEEKYWKETAKLAEAGEKRRESLNEETEKAIQEQRQTEFDQWVQHEEEKARKYEAAWSTALQGIGMLAQAIGGKLGGIFNAVGQTAYSLRNWSKMSGTDKATAIAGGVGQIGDVIGGTAGGALSGAAGGAMAGIGIGTAFGGPAGAAIGGAIGGVVGLIGGLFGASKQKKEEQAKEAAQFKEMTDQLIKQYGSLKEAASAADKYGVNLQKALDSKKPKELDAALKELEKRMAGLETATAGVQQLIDNLTYTDAAGNLMDTFSDPSVATSASNLFSAQFWQVFQKKGIAGLDAMRPQWSKLLTDLNRMGLDPVAMGLGRVGRMMDLTNDPKTRALLGASQGVGAVLKGSMDAGYLDKGMLADASNVAKSTLKELQDNGMTAEEAAQAQEDQLAQLAAAYKQTGQDMPTWLTDAMSAAGMELMPTQLDVLKESRDYLKQIAGAPGYASGGHVSTPHLAWVGEHGPEDITPSDGSGYQGGQRGGLTVNVYRAPGMTVETEAAFDRRIARTMDRALRTDARVRQSARTAANGGR